MVIILLLISLIPVAAILAYPAVSFLKSRFFSKTVHRSDQFLAPVSIVIACYNEELFIRNKILSFLDPDEWIEGSEIIVVSGGSTDGTNRILEEFSTHNSVKTWISEDQLSKIAGVNHGVSMAKHALLVFSDCRQQMQKGSVKAMVHNFNDPEVGTVAAVLKDPDENTRQSIMRRAINRIAALDSTWGSAMTLYGALYAQRRELFRPFPEDQLFDDLCVIVNTLAKHKRLVHEQVAVIHDVPFASYYSGERLERLTRGLLLFITRQWALIRATGSWNLIRLIVLKYVKLLLPVSVIIWFTVFFIWIIPVMNPLIIWGCAGITLILLSNKSIRRSIWLMLKISFHLLNAIVGFFLLNQRSARWKKLKMEPSR